VFTGIVETVGTIRSIQQEADLARLEIEAPEIAEGVRIGDSVAVSGGCLTITKEGGGRFEFEAIQETLEKTKLGELRVGSRVNLERAMRADGRLDGHIVQGHVDGTGRVRCFERQGDDVRLAVECDAELLDCLVDKGSVAIDGVSLTVVQVGDGWFDVALIPHTLAVTTLGELSPGDRVNLEADVLGKYVKRYMERVLQKNGRSD